MTAADGALLAKQRQEIKACLDSHIPKDRPVALLQFPGDFNVGNHMMWVAINNYLKQRGVRIAYSGWEYNFRLQDLVGAVRDGPILFIGGVTVSRIWPSHVEIKRLVAAACPDNRLISLPSTMLFVDDDDRQAASSIFGGHRDVVMLARDPLSAHSARQLFPEPMVVSAIHDSTFLLPKQPRKRKATHDIIWLARADQEGTGAKAPDDVHVFDWADYVQGCRTLLLAGRAFSRLRTMAPSLTPMANPQITAFFDRASRVVLASGNRQLDAGKVLVTDRLHPHILATLRSQPCVLLPDRYGKNRAVFDYSSGAYSTVHWADTPEQALVLARDLATGCR